MIRIPTEGVIVTYPLQPAGLLPFQLSYGRVAGGPAVPGLRPSHYRLLDYTPLEGIRLTDLPIGPT